MHPMSDIDVSVIIPFWKRPDFLFEGIESILAQTYTGKVEIIVVDDGSPEDISVSLPQRFPTVRLLRKVNGGTSDARHYGTQRAEGRYLAYLDDDDLWLPEKLATQVALLETHPELEYTYCDAIKFDASGDTGESIYTIFPQLAALNPPRIGQSATDFLILRDALVPLFYQVLYPVYPSTFIIRADFLRRVGGWNHTMRASGEDLDLLVRASHAGAGAFQAQILTRIRRHFGGNQSSDILGHTCMNQAELERVCEEYPEPLRTRVRALLGHRLANIGWFAWQDRRFRMSFDYYTRALRRGYVKPAVLARWLAAGARGLLGPDAAPRRSPT